MSGKKSFHKGRMTRGRLSRRNLLEEEGWDKKVDLEKEKKKRRSRERKLRKETAESNRKLETWLSEANADTMKQVKNMMMMMV